MPAAAQLSIDPPAAVTRTWVEWNQDYVTTTCGGGSGGATITVVANEGETTRVIWRSWNEAYSATGTASVLTTTIDEGTTGAGGGGTTSSVTGNIFDPWPAWNQMLVRTGGSAAVHVVPRISDEEFRARRDRQEAERREQLAQWEAGRAEREARQRAELAEWEAAKARAALLLRENLTPQQQAELAEKQYFTLRTIRPNGEERFYRIHRGRTHNIERVDAAGRRIQRYCMHPIIHCPDEDTMLTQKLWLQNPDLEEQLLRQANRS